MNNPFTVEEINVICIYSATDRQKAIDGLFHVLPYERDLEMLDIIYHAIDKLSNMSNAEFKELNLVPVEE